MSRTRQLATSGSSLSSSSRAEPNTSARKPTDRKRFESALGIEGSSSTTKTMASLSTASVMRCPPPQRLSLADQVSVHAGQPGRRQGRRPPRSSDPGAAALKVWSRRLLPGWRQRERERRPWPSVGRCPYPPSVRLDDGTADRQSHAHPVGLGGEEGIEQLMHILGIDANPIVLYLYQHLAVFALARPDQQLTRTVGNGCHGLDAVDRQIHDDLLQLNPVGEHHRQRGRELEPQAHPIVEQLSLNQQDQLLDDVVEIEQGPLWNGFLQEPSQTPNNLARPHPIADHALQCSADLLQLRRPIGEPPQASLAIGDDSRKRLVPLVRDRRSQFTQCRQARHMSQFRLGLLQRFLGPIAFGDVHESDQNAAQRRWLRRKYNCQEHRHFVVVQGFQKGLRLEQSSTFGNSDQHLRKHLLGLGNKDVV